MHAAERIDPVRAWLAVAAAVVVAAVAGSLVLPRLVWEGFLWRYLWGPVYADAHNARCAARDGGVSLLSDADACADAAARGLVVAEPGYTLVSEAVYAAVLLFALVGVLFLLRRLEVGGEPEFLLGLLPFMLFGGALRVVEDALDAAGRAGVSPPIEYPLNTPLISPLIYVTVFVVALAALLWSLHLEATGRFDRYVRPLAGIGSAVLVLTLGVLAWLAATTGYVGFYPQVAVVVLVVTGLITAGAWWAVGRYAPGLNRGTGTLGLVVLAAHVLDGVANVVGIDWGAELGLPYGDLVPKHPINRAMIDVGEAVNAALLSAGGAAMEPLTEVLQTAWPFLVLKVAAALFVVGIFDEAIFEESPRYAVLLLVAIVAVGLGPGTRDMLRATFGISAGGHPLQPGGPGRGGPAQASRPASRLRVGVWRPVEPGLEAELPRDRPGALAEERLAGEQRLGARDEHPHDLQAERLDVAGRQPDRVGLEADRLEALRQGVEQVLPP